jgi:sodium-dependent phosphate cotransporter
VTNTIVSLSHITVIEEFERAFACAVIHDIFNWLAVLIFLPIEVITGYLFHLSEAVVNGITVEQGKVRNAMNVFQFPFARTDGCFRILRSC